VVFIDKGSFSTNSGICAAAGPLAAAFLPEFAVVVLVRRVSAPGDAPHVAQSPRRSGRLASARP
jgi:hypothetical protein